LKEAVRTAVINKRAGGMGLISGRKSFQRADEGGSRVTTRNSGRVPQPVGNHRVKLAFLGTGSAFSLERYNGAVVVNGRLLLDGGAPLLPHMSRVGVDAGAIDVVFLHALSRRPHAGLPPFVLYRVFVDPRPITFVGPAGIEERLNALWEVSWGVDWKPVMLPRFNVKYEVAKPSGKVAGYKYETVKLDHGRAGATGIGSGLTAASLRTPATPSRRHPSTSS